MDICQIQILEYRYSMRITRTAVLVSILFYVWINIFLRFIQNFKETYGLIRLLRIHASSLLNHKGAAAHFHSYYILQFLVSVIKCLLAHQDQDVRFELGTALKRFPASDIDLLTHYTYSPSRSSVTRALAPLIIILKIASSNFQFRPFYLFANFHRIVAHSYTLLRFESFQGSLTDLFLTLAGIFI